MRSTREPQSLADRCRATLVAAPAGSVVSHATAARLHRMWLPAVVLEPDVVYVILTREANRLRRRTVVTHRGLERRAVTLVEGVPVTAAPDTWADLAGELSPADLVAAADGIARREGGMTALTIVADARRRRRMPHAADLLTALARSRPASTSRMESLARLRFTDAGLDEPEINVAVRDVRGQGLAEVDFLWRRAGLIVEYQSELHLGDPHRRADDEYRRRLLEAAGYCVAFITAATVLDSKKAADLLTYIGDCLGRLPRLP